MPLDAIYTDNGVVVTKTIVRVDNASYPIQGIGSVFIKADPRPPAAPFFVFAAVFAILSVILLMGDLTAGFFVFGVTAFIFIIAGYGRVKSDRIYNLVLRTSSGDQELLRSTNIHRLQAIKEGIERAVDLRG